MPLAFNLRFLKALSKTQIDIFLFLGLKTEKARKTQTKLIKINKITEIKIEKDKCVVDADHPNGNRGFVELVFSE